jgi:PHD/YefM family antitoxin component YafN of YafNO toxin-antitoxin module
VKWFVMTEAEFEQYREAVASCIEAPTPANMKHYKDAIAACRARRVEEDALGYWVEVGE